MVLVRHLLTPIHGLARLIIAKTPLVTIVLCPSLGSISPAGNGLSPCFQRWSYRQPVFTSKNPELWSCCNCLVLHFLNAILDNDVVEKLLPKSTKYTGNWWRALFKTIWDVLWNYEGFIACLWTFEITETSTILFYLERETEHDGSDCIFVYGWINTGITPENL